MSRSSDSRKMGDVLAMYALVTVPEAARFLRTSQRQVREMIQEGQLHGIPVGKRWRLDPIELAVYRLAYSEGLTPDEYREKHGDAVTLHTRRFVRDILRQTA